MKKKISFQYPFCLLTNVGREWDLNPVAIGETDRMQRQELQCLLCSWQVLIPRQEVTAVANQGWLNYHGLFLMDLFTCCVLSGPCQRWWNKNQGGLCSALWGYAECVSKSGRVDSTSVTTPVCPLSSSSQLLCFPTLQEWCNSTWVDK